MPTPDSRIPQLSRAQRAQFAAEWNQHPGMRHMGVRLDLSDPGVVRAIVSPVLEHHRGGMGTDAVNGAVIAGVFDLVVGLTGYLETGGRPAGVAQLHVHYLRPVRGDRFLISGRPSRVGRSLTFVSAQLEDEHGVVCARADGIVAVGGGEPGGAPAF